MQPQSPLSYANYWLQTIEHLSLLSGRFDNEDIRDWSTLNHQQLLQGRIDAQLNTHFFADLPISQNSVDLVIRPIAFSLKNPSEGSKTHCLSEYIFPITTVVTLKRNGRLYPKRSYFASDLLEPVLYQDFAIGQHKIFEHLLRNDKDNELYTFTHPTSLEESNDNTSIYQQWNTYLSACEKVINAVAASWLKQQQDYHQLRTAYLHLPLQCPTTAPLQNLYRKAIKKLANAPVGSHPLPLFERYASNAPAELQAGLSLHEGFSKRLSTLSEQTRYTENQRNILAHAAVMQEGEILAINTPPHTGEINIMEGIVATQWAQAAMAEMAHPPLTFIVTDSEPVQSTFHQEIFNIFGLNLLQADNPFEGRWLPRFKQPKSRVYTAAEAQLQYSENWEEIFAPFETEGYIEAAKEDYLLAAQLNYPQIQLVSIEDVVHFIHQSLVTESARLLHLEEAWGDVLKYQEEEQKRSLQQAREQIPKQEEKVKQALAETEIFSRYYHRCHELNRGQNSGFSSFFAVISSSQERQKFQQLRQFIETNCPLEFDYSNLKTSDEIMEQLEQIYTNKNLQLAQLSAELQELHITVNAEKLNTINWAEACVDLISESKIEEINTLAQADTAAYLTIRYKIHQLTTHYWEGRWLLAMQEWFKENPSLLFSQDKEAQKKWHLRMMLIPALATTVTQLPAKLSAAPSIEKSHDLFNGIALLLIHQAERLSPDFAGALLTLAKKAIMLGDTNQTSPYSLLQPHDDRMLLSECGLLSQPDNTRGLLQLSHLGVVSSMGSSMHRSQTASSFQQPSQPRGLSLTEQFKSYQEIVHYSNLLSYRGQLEAVRDRKIIAAINERRMLDILPPMGYVHVAGHQTLAANQSPVNLEEAESIALWLHKNKSSLERFYKKNLWQIVYIVTPFLGQAEAISKACSQLGIECSPIVETYKITVNPAYHLPNAGFPVILYSHVFSKHMSHAQTTQEARFERKLLNRTISHATDAFLCFADMDTLWNSSPQSAKGILYTALSSATSNQLPFEPVARQDLLQHQDELEVKILSSEREHALFLQQLFSQHHQQIFISCPALELYDVQNTPLWHYLVSAVESGTSVHLYTNASSTSPASEDEPAPANAQLKEMIHLFASHNMKVHLLHQVHQIQLIADRTLYCIGSSHWFNPQGNPSAKTIAYQGLAVAKEIGIQKIALRTQQIAG